MSGRGYLWYDLSAEVRDEFAALADPGVHDGLPPVQPLRERVDRLREDAEDARLYAVVAPLLRRERHRSYDRRRGREKRSGQCSRDYCERDRTATTKLCQHHREMSCRAAAACARKKRRNKMTTTESVIYERLPRTREGLTMHFTIVALAPKVHREDPDGVVEVDGYVTTGVYEDGRLAEFFVRVSKLVASMGPGMDCWAIATSKALQRGVPVGELLEPILWRDFEPSGVVVGVEGIRRCTSPYDLIARWLLLRYGPKVEVARDETDGGTKLDR